MSYWFLYSNVYNLCLNKYVGTKKLVIMPKPKEKKVFRFAKPITLEEGSAHGCSPINQTTVLDKLNLEYTANTRLTIEDAPDLNCQQIGFVNQGNTRIGVLAIRVAPGIIEKVSSYQLLVNGTISSKQERQIRDALEKIIQPS